MSSLIDTERRITRLEDLLRGLSPIEGASGVTGIGSIASGSGAASQVAYWSGSNTITGSSSITTDGTSLTLGSSSQIIFAADVELVSAANANILIGQGHDITGATDVVGIGTAVQTYGAGSVSIGYDARSGYQGSPGVGIGYQAYARDGVSIGWLANKDIPTGAYAHQTAVGRNTIAYGDESVAIGMEADAGTYHRATALGPYATVTQDDGVVIYGTTIQLQTVQSPPAYSYIMISNTGAVNRVPYFGDGQTLVGDANLTYNASTVQFSVGGTAETEGSSLNYPGTFASADKNDTRVSIRNDKANATTNQIGLDLRANSTTQIRTVGLVLARFTNTTDADRTSKLGLGVANAGSFQYPVQIEGHNIGLFFTGFTGAGTAVWGTSADRVLAVANATAAPTTAITGTQMWSSTSGLNIMYTATLGWVIGDKFGAFGVAAVARASAFTQTYSTSTKTHANLTATAVASTGATQTTPFGYTTAAQADAIVTAINALIVDVANVKQVLNALIDDLQLYGLEQ